MAKKLIIKKNVSSFLPTFFEKYELKDIGVFSGATFTYKIAKKVLNEILPFLAKNFKDAVKICESSPKYVKIVEEVIRKNKVKLALVIGGGTPCDVVKLASYKTGINFIYLPTTLSHDGISSERARIKGKIPYSVKAKPPLYVIVDLEIIKNSPLRNIRAGFGDGFGKCISLSDWKLDCEINKESCEIKFNKKIEKRVANNFKNLVNLAKKGCIGKERTLKKLAAILYNFGECMNKVKSSRPCSGSEHLFSHALDIIAPIPAFHGEQVSLGTLACLYFYNKYGIEPYGIEWGFMRDICKSIKLPVNSKEIGIDKKYLITALGKVAREIGKRRKRFTILEHLKVNKKEAAHCLKKVGII